MKQFITMLAGLCVLASGAFSAPARAKADQEAKERALQEFWRARLLAPLSIRNHEIVMPPPVPTSILAQEEARLLQAEAGLSASLTSRRLAVNRLWLGYVDSLLIRGGTAYLDVFSSTISANTSNEVLSFPPLARMPSKWLDELDEKIRKRSLPAREVKVTEDKAARRLRWWSLDQKDQCRGERYSSTSYCREIPSFGNTDAMVWAGPAVKDKVTRYWQQTGKTHIRISMGEMTAEEIHAWAEAHGMALRLRLRRGEPPVYVHEPVIVQGETAIPVFIVSPQGLTPARIVAFAVGGESCDGSNWLELALENDAAPPVWAFIALRDPDWAKNARVTRLDEQETLTENNRRYLENRRGILQLAFADEPLPPLTLIARRLGWVERRYAINPEKEEWIMESEEALDNIWTTEVLRGTEFPVNNDYEAIHKSRITSLGSPRCPPP